VDVETLNRIILALVAGQPTPKAAGLPNTDEVRKPWNEIKAEIDAWPPGIGLDLPHEFPDLP
jgi:hypothetical protein